MQTIDFDTIERELEQALIHLARANLTSVESPLLKRIVADYAAGSRDSQLTAAEQKQVRQIQAMNGTIMDAIKTVVAAKRTVDKRRKADAT